jgi:hypothetical protein
MKQLNRLSFSRCTVLFDAAAEKRESMAFKRKQKLVLAEIDPLRDAGILQHIFEFLPGCWLFLGAVCREWEAVYASMPY